MASKDDGPDVLYVENAGHGVVACNKAHFDRYMTEKDEEGRTYTRHGYKVITEAQARKANPQLFGKLDPQITFTDDELARAATRRRTLDELFPEQAQEHAATLARMLPGAE